MEFAISIENLSKRYRLGVIGTGTLTHDLNRWWAGIRGKEDPFLKIGMENRLNVSGGDYVWAIDNINLNIREGEILGIIGKNGAGKSTLLKLLSRVTAPTSGTIKMRGRVASLLEVGTGFHPELTGRENVFLNGAILGMTKNEIKLKFDEIIDFSGIGKYIDTPVKRYSSGMYVRLAFAVAAHLEPEVLIVDEVLAVGDAEFQKKAIGKMHEVSQGNGRTVLFVSHNMGSIQNLCNRVILVNNGKLLFDGDPQETINKYLQNIDNLKSNSSGLQSQYRKGLGDIKFHDLSILEKDILKTGSGLELSIKLLNSTLSVIRNVRIDIGIDNSQGIRVAHLSNLTINKTISLTSQVITEEVFIIENLPLVAGRYGLTLYCEAAGQVQDWITNAFFFDIENSDFYKTGKLPPEGQGSILLKYKIEQV